MTIDTDDMMKFRAEMERLRGAYIMDISVACDMYVAALARAEAAITESNSTARRAFSAEVENQRLTKEAAGLRARAEAAEAEVARLRDAGRLVQEEVAAWRDGYRDLGEQRLALAARVAELESQLAAAGSRVIELEAAQDESYHAYLELKEEADSRGEPLREACRQNMILTARVAELEAQLAAQGWRPVTEEPALRGLYQAGGFLENGTLCDVGHTFWEEGGWVDECDHELLPNMAHYRPIGRPLPAPAPDTEPTP